MKSIHLLLLMLLFCIPGCDDQKLAHAFARQIEALNGKIEAAHAPIADAMIRATYGLSPASAQALESARIQALADVRAIRDEFQSSIQSHPGLAFGKEMHEAFAKYLEENIRLLEVDLSDVIDLMYRSLAKPDDNGHQLNLAAKLKDYGAKSTRATKDVNAMLRNFGSANGMKVYGN